jgi:uncharacterized protein YjbJ (UPF0337 family)
MDKDRIEGKMEDVKGRVKRQVGEWTGDTELQGEGAMDQAKGKVQNAFGKAKDAIRDAGDKARGREIRHEEEARDRDLKDDVA